ncbi:MAG: FG-GAP-like repeat-containing protein [Acidobacteria bacterium]|nr:FG-GAP-like repeat-containing protein [Acidobacteriota bacterium]
MPITRSYNRTLKAKGVSIVSLLILVMFSYPQQLDKLEQAKPKLGSGDLEGALNLLNTLQTSDPNNLEIHLLLSQAYQQKNDLTQMKAHLLKVLEIQPESVRGHFGMVQYHHALREFDEAEQHSLKVIRAKPKFYEDQLIRGLFLSDWNPVDWEETINALQAALKNGRDPDVAHFWLGKSYQWQGKFAESIPFLRKTASLAGYEDSSHFLLGISLYRMSRFQEAIKEFMTTLQINPGYIEALWALRLSYQALGGYPKDLDPKYLFQVNAPGSTELLKFTEVGHKAGVDRKNWGRASGWADIDGDGDLDLITGSVYGGVGVYRNDNRKFTEITQQSGITSPSAWSILLFDYDNDGDPDLYIARDGWNGPAPNFLYQNDGKGHFTDVTQKAGVANAEGSSFCASVADYDRDGFLDIYVANGVVGRGVEGVLFHNNRDGTFTNVAAKAGVNFRGRTIGSAWGDYNNDNNPDLLITGEFNILYRNNGDGTFTDVSQAAGIESTGLSYVCWFFDCNADGKLDIFVSAYGDFDNALWSLKVGQSFVQEEQPLLFRNNGDGTFTKVTQGTGLNQTFGSMGANFGDLDYDAYPEIYLANGGADMGRMDPDALFYNHQGKSFTNLAFALNTAEFGKSHGVTFADYDGDGDLDVYVPVGGFAIGDAWTNRLFRNDSKMGNSLILQLQGTPSNRDAVGARAEVAAGTLHYAQEVAVGGGFGSTNSLELELGLGANTKADLIRIRWPSGSIQEWVALEGGFRYLIQEGTKQWRRQPYGKRNPS